MRGAYIGREGRCTERACMEYHHVQPYAAGGASTTTNIEPDVARTTSTRRRSSSGVNVTGQGSIQPRCNYQAGASSGRIA
jgi:hypothetical protein